MKLKPDHKVLFIFAGILFAWFAVFIMLTAFYEGLVQAIIVTTRGGTYEPYYLRRETGAICIICIFVSSICLAIGLRMEELK